VIRACGSMEKTRNACSILVVKPERKVWEPGLNLSGSG
jgi:hypothetical protein